MTHFPDDTTIFLLRDINCHNRIQLISKSHEKASSSKKKTIQKFINYKNINIIDKPGQIIWS